MSCTFLRVYTHTGRESLPLLGPVGGASVGSSCPCLPSGAQVCTAQAAGVRIGASHLPSASLPDPKALQNFAQEPAGMANLRPHHVRIQNPICKSSCY